MVLHCWRIFVVSLSVCAHSIVADDQNELLYRLDATEKVVQSLSHRVDMLESREKLYLQRIAELESTDQFQQETIEELKHQLQDLVEPVSESETTVADERTDNGTIGIRQEANIQLTKRTIVADRGYAMQRIRQVNVESPVAFLAFLSNKLEHAGVDQIIVFDQVLTNINGHYNQAVGIFMAPFEGIYVFSTTLAADGSTETAHASFFHNNNRINKMYVDMDRGIMTSSTITLHLQRGDVVTVRNGDPNDAYYGFQHCSFTGFLLSNYESVQSIVG